MHILTTRIKSLKIIFEPLEWLNTCFDAFAHTSRPPESSSLKRYFLQLEWLKTCFDAFPGHQNQFLKKDIFQRPEWLKTCMMHLRILPDHQNQVRKKDIF